MPGRQKHDTSSSPVLDDLGTFLRCFFSFLLAFLSASRDLAATSLSTNLIPESMRSKVLQIDWQGQIGFKRPSLAELATEQYKSLYAFKDCSAKEVCSEIFPSPLARDRSERTECVPGCQKSLSNRSAQLPVCAVRQVPDRSGDKSQAA